ncbi:MAG TPA: hypothetical protein VJ793_13885 [Anaerolineae bacterium]|nr:hypothetical protein [Anaerolineae bacterium]
MRNRLSRIVLSLVVGSIVVAIGLYLGWFIAIGLQAARTLSGSVRAQPSRETVALVTDVTRWTFLGLTTGLGLAFAALHKHRVRFLLASIAGFALGGALASWLVVTSLDRAAPAATLALPLGGALAGLLLGLGARLDIRSALMLIVVALAMMIAGPFIDPRSSVMLPSPLRLTLSDWLILLAPGALIGAILAALVPTGSDTSQTA